VVFLRGFPLLFAAFCALAAPTTAYAEDPGGAVPAISGGAAPAQLVVAAGASARIVAGRAIPPAGAPAPVKQAILRANDLIGKPYRWGGGHRSFAAGGYDCSGAVSYALHGGGLLSSPLDSTSFLRWGDSGPGRWVTVYTNPGHAYMAIAGIRLDTSSAGDPGGGRGPRWRPLRRSNSGFHTRHPEGL
jgi:hypothetical protein